jgi:hypothetical protein
MTTSNDSTPIENAQKKSETCQQCGNSIDSGVLLGLCPACRQSSRSSDAAASTPSVSRRGLWSEVWLYLRIRKKWWLAPMLVILVALGALAVFTETSAMAPFIYTLF